MVTAIQSLRWPVQVAASRVRRLPAIQDVGWLSLITVVLASGRRIMSRRAYQVVLGACGVFLLALGGWFLASGVGYVA